MQYILFVFTTFSTLPQYPNSYPILCPPNFVCPPLFYKSFMTNLCSPTCALGGVVFSWRVINLTGPTLSGNSHTLSPSSQHCQQLHNLGWDCVPKSFVLAGFAQFCVCCHNHMCETALLCPEENVSL